MYVDVLGFYVPCFSLFFRELKLGFLFKAVLQIIPTHGSHNYVWLFPITILWVYCSNSSSQGPVHLTDSRHSVLGSMLNSASSKVGLCTWEQSQKTMLRGTRIFFQQKPNLIERSYKPVNAVFQSLARQEKVGVPVSTSHTLKVCDGLFTFILQYCWSWCWLKDITAEGKTIPPRHYTGLLDSAKGFRVI